jgi:GT2 family glycosyltransferase
VDATLIVPLDGSPDQALRCLEALAGLADEPTHEVVIVDDGSVGLDDLLTRLDGDVEIVRLAERRGLAAAAAAGAAKATGDVVVLIRDAAEVRPGFLAPLVDALGTQPDLAAAAPDASTPVAAHALAWRRADLSAADMPQAPAALAIAALCTALARTGRVETIAASTIDPPGARSAIAAARGHLGADPELSIVIPTLDAAGDRVRACVAAVQRATDAPHEIVIVDNGAPPQGFAAPVNSGLRAARGAYMVVCNDDVEVLPGWWAPLRAALDASASVAFPMTIDGAMRPDFAAWCFALSRATLDEFGVAPGEFLHPELKVWYQDTDLLHRLRLAGRPPQLVPESRIRHGLSETVATADPGLRAWIDAQILRDKARFEALHGSAVPGAAR